MARLLPCALALALLSCCAEPLHVTTAQTARRGGEPVQQLYLFLGYCPGSFIHAHCFVVVVVVVVCFFAALMCVRACVRACGGLATKSAFKYVKIRLYHPNHQFVTFMCHGASVILRR